MGDMAVIIIGRNEGERLRRSLLAVADKVSTVVYVDSGSTDGSVEMARELGAEVVELDMSIPFTASRARNAGFEHLRHIAAETEFVQFVDGDCELVEGWLKAARDELVKRPEVAIACGRLREREPDASIYNRLCELEWNAPAGEVQGCGGIFMIRAEAFSEVGRFDPSLIAGEEPELCVRLRKAGWKIWRLGRDMARHDAAMTRFAQWWKRSVRAGHTYAEGFAMHGAKPEQHKMRQLRSALFWGVAAPVAVLGALALAWWQPWVLAVIVLVLAGYALLASRIYRSRRERGDSPRDAALYTMFCTLGKYSEGVGALGYYLNRLSGRRRGLIEYK